MKNKHNLLGIFLAASVGVALLCAMIVRAFFPRIIIPNFDGTYVVALSLITLVIDYYFAGGSRRDYRLIPVYAAFVFGIFPWAACFLVPLSAVKFAVMGAVIFTVVSLLFDTIIDRLSSGPASKVAPLVSAIGLFLAAQCLMGII